MTPQVAIRPCRVEECEAVLALWRGGIYRLAVDPQTRRRGIAKALVRAAESVLWRRGARRMSVLVERHEAHAVAFWDSLAEAGYQRDPRMMRYVKALGGDGS